MEDFGLYVLGKDRGRDVFAYRLCLNGLGAVIFIGVFNASNEVPFFKAIKIGCRTRKIPLPLSPHYTRGRIELDFIPLDASILCLTSLATLHTLH